MEIVNDFRSTYDYVFKTYRCLYCHAPIALTPESLELLIQEKRDAILRDRGADFFYLSPEQDAILRREVETQEKGICLSDKQCLHDRCLEIVKQDQVTWEKIKSLDRRLMPLPNAQDFNIYEVYYNNSLQLSRHFCGFCQNLITGSLPGFAYCKKSDATKDCLFLHHSCFGDLCNARTKRLETEALVRRRELNFLTADLLVPQKAINEIAIRHDRWIRLMRSVTLDEQEQDAFIDWYAFLMSQKNTWNEKQMEEWSAHHKEEDIQSLREVIFILTAKEREEMQKQINSLKKDDESLCKNNTMQRDHLLYHNLLLIQAYQDRGL